MISMFRWCVDIVGDVIINELRPCVRDRGGEGGGEGGEKGGVIERCVESVC